MLLSEQRIYYETQELTVESQLVPFGQHQVFAPRVQGKYPVVQLVPVEPEGATSAATGPAMRDTLCVASGADATIGGSFIGRPFLTLGVNKSVSDAAR